MTAPYQARAAEHGVRRDLELKRSLQISRARLAVFLIGSGCVIWTLVQRGGSAWLAVDLLLGIVFGVLGMLAAEPLVATALVLIKRLYVEDVVGDDVSKQT